MANGRLRGWRSCWGIKLFIIAACFLSFPAFAKSKRSPKRFEIGAIFLKPTGLSVAYRLSRRGFVQGIWAFSNDIEVHASYLRGQRKPAKIGGIKFPWYYTVGGFYRGTDVSSFGPKFMLGGRYRPKNTSLAVIGEVGVLVDIHGRSGLDLGAGLGCRYRF